MLTTVVAVRAGKAASGTAPPGTPGRRSTALRAFHLVAAVLVVTYLLSTLWRPPETPSTLFDGVVGNLGYAACAGLCFSMTGVFLKLTGDDLANYGIAHTATDWVGYALAATLALRLLWGVIGPPEARFSAFPPSPGRALDHIREIAEGRRSEHASHNPLGALMVYAIWSTLAAIVVWLVLHRRLRRHGWSLPHRQAHLRG